tara:strand:- start:1200 stop:1904 length:705 start_codon:yes stop_codon:yes gene_type:complete
MKKMSFIDHLEELRIRTLKSIFIILFFSIVSYYFSDFIIQFLVQPIKNNLINLQVLKITSVFLIKIGVSIVSGILFSFPLILYQMLKFLLPAFEKKLTNFKIIFVSILCLSLFILGLLFGYRLLIPLSIAFFNSLSLNLDFVNLNYTLENYLVYLIWILIISSMIFQIPVIIVFLIKVGILSREFLSRNRGYVIVFIFIIAALLSPPDPISQILIVIPLYVLFELSLFLTKFIK